MGSGCGGNRKRSGGIQAAARPSKTTYEPLADQVSGNYPGSIVRPPGATDTAAAPAQT